MSRGKRFRALIRSARFNLLMMALFLALSIVGMDILQRSLLANSQETGMSLAQSFSVEEERNIFAYETLMELESEYLESYLQEGASEEELQEWISSFYQNVNSVFDKTPIDPYAVVDGRVIAAQPWEGRRGSGSGKHRVVPPRAGSGRGNRFFGCLYGCDP